MGAVLAQYDELVRSGEVRPDAAQLAVAGRLDALSDVYARQRTDPGWFGRWFGPASARPRGIYLWGAVGRGKSMLMDLFFACAPAATKRRVHFAEFMLEVHGLMHDFRTLPAVERARAFPKSRSSDPIPAVAARLAGGAQLLCFDEFQVTNIADAMILGRLLVALWALDVTLVVTSNRPPQDLYLDGLQREHFLTVIQMIGERMDVVSLDGPTDYRLERLAGVQVYHVPNGPAATAALADAFFRLTDFDPENRARVPSETLDVQGRALFVPKALKGVAVFSFRRLCGEARWSADYLAVARRYHTVFIVGIPVMPPDMRNEAARFRVLIDALYENSVKLICSADAAPDGLYRTGDDSFEFQRTVSRLMEMQSARYLARGHGVAA